MSNASTVGPLDSTRTNLFNAHDLLNSINEKLGYHPPPSKASGDAAEPITVQAKINDNLTLASDIRVRLADLLEFVSQF